MIASSGSYAFQGRRDRVKSADWLTQSLNDMRSSYEAARDGRTRRRRKGVSVHGSGANYHYRSDADFLRIMEYARDYERNDMVFSSFVDRAAINAIQSGTACKFNSGDKKLDQDLTDRWQEEQNDPEAVDAEGNLTFLEMEYVSYLRDKICGSVFGILTDGGQMQIVEAHRARSPNNRQKKRKIIHGVEVERDSDRVKGYFFTREDYDGFYPQSRLNLSDLKFYSKFNEDGRLAVLHRFDRRRSTQTRGVSAAAPVFSAIEMHDDIQFAKLLHQQVASAFVLFRNRAATWTPDENKNLEQAPESLDGSRLSEIRPGMFLKGDPGETLSMDSPNVPNPEFFLHVRLVLNILSVNFGLPLIISMMDGSETNFSSWRGAYDQAKMGFRRGHKIAADTWYAPFMRHKIYWWGREDGPLGRAIKRRGGSKKVNPYRHEWCPQAWPYVSPVEDATADILREANGLTSARRRSLERLGVDYVTVMGEVIDDRGKVFERAMQEVNRLNDLFGLVGAEKFKWQDFVPLPTAQGVSLAMQTPQQNNQGASKDESDS